MEWFAFCFDTLCLAGQGVVQFFFVTLLTGTRRRVSHFAVYLFLLCIVEWCCASFALPSICAVGIQILILCGMSRYVLGNCGSVSWVAAVLAIYIFQLSSGIVNSAEAVLFPALIGEPLLYLLLLLAALIMFFLCAGCYAAVLRFLSFKEDGQTMQIGSLLLPVLFFFASQWYLLHTSYHDLPVTLSLTAVGKHGALLLLQVLGLGALLCTLYAYGHLCRSFQAQTALASLSQAVRAQKVYIAEAQTRYEQTKAFRHDIQNHLSVLDALIDGGKWQESRAYLQKLKTIASALSFPYRTGNPIVDILLSEKLGGADETVVDVSLCIPRSCAIDDIDLCVIFANALDNALYACRALKSGKFISVRGERQGDFYLLIFENSCDNEPLAPMGTGLSNIKAAAEKYRGAMLTEKRDGRFSLSVLLNIS